YSCYWFRWSCCDHPKSTRSITAFVWRGKDGAAVSKTFVPSRERPPGGNQGRGWDDALERFSLQAAVITGIEYEEDKTSIEEKSGISIRMGNLVMEKKEASWYFAPKRGGGSPGTGDLFASVLSATTGAGDFREKLCGNGSEFPWKCHTGCTVRRNRQK
ncbi:MAG: hypothetical protein V8Q57_09205, partial [Blautia sp.]